MSGGVILLRLRLADLQQWVYNHRLFLWIVIFLLSLATILAIVGEELWSAPDLLENTALSFQYKVLNTNSIIFLTRLLLAALGVVVLLICLFFPVFRLGKEGIQWTKEMEEELVRYSGEITGEEVEELINEEAVRWSLVHRWLLPNVWKGRGRPDFLRELLATIWEAFPHHQISLTLIGRDRSRVAILHPLLLELAEDESALDKESIGFGLDFTDGEKLLLAVHSREVEGFSSIDRIFLAVLGEIFSQEVMDGGVTLMELLASFEQVTLTPAPDGV